MPGLGLRSPEENGGTLTQALSVGQEVHYSTKDTYFPEGHFKTLGGFGWDQIFNLEFVHCGHRVRRFLSRVLSLAKTGCAPWCDGSFGGTLVTGSADHGTFCDAHHWEWNVGMRS